MKQNSKCRSFCGRDEMINHIINECSKLAQKEYKTMWTNQICTTSNLSKWMRHKIFWDFETNMLVSARRPDLVIVNKKKRTCQIFDDAIPADRVRFKEGEESDKYLDLAREQKNLQNMKEMVIPIIVGALRKICKGLVKGLED